MKRYVLGFAFDNGRCANVALIRKNRPLWQAGSLNGIGGHIEDGESPLMAMVREFEEETGLLVPAWEPYHIMFGTSTHGDTPEPETWECHTFRAFDVALDDLKTMTDEQVTVVDSRKLPDNVLVNLHWLIPLALDHEPRYTTTKYSL